MARFIKNGPCPNCSSRDNLAHYSDGSLWCWGCHYFRPADTPDFRSNLPVEEESKPKFHELPKDCSLVYGKPAMDWLSQYPVTIEELRKRNVVYSESRQQLIYKFLDRQGKLLGWQARNFNPDYQKVWNPHPIQGLIPIYYNEQTSDTIVLVEDPLSALSIASIVDSMPLLGTTLATQKIIALRGYKSVLVWLDSDKYKEAQKMADRCKMMGLSSTAVFSEQDPKFYTTKEIKEIVEKA